MRAPTETERVIRAAQFEQVTNTATRRIVLATTPAARCPAPVATFTKFRTEQARARRRQHAAVGQ